MYEKLHQTNFYSDQDERAALIDWLQERYPYPRPTWSRKTTPQLWAIYWKTLNPSKPRHPKEPEEEHIAILTPEDEGYKPARYRENGVDYILADSGEYIEEEN